jgi:uncharacterized membrane protein YagU involved in acid resistance
MDITAAFLVYGLFGLKPIPLLQGIAAGLLGSRSFTGGLSTAALGLFCHFFIAFSAAAVYFAASRRFSFLLRQPVAFGALYGMGVYFFMRWVVVPLSAAKSSPFSLKMMAIGLTIHVICVGLPIALSARRFSA